MATTKTTTPKRPAEMTDAELGRALTSAYRQRERFERRMARVRGDTPGTAGQRMRDVKWLLNEMYGPPPEAHELDDIDIDDEEDEGAETR